MFKKIKNLLIKHIPAQIRYSNLIHKVIISFHFLKTYPFNKNIKKYLIGNHFSITVGVPLKIPNLDNNKWMCDKEFVEIKGNYVIIKKELERDFTFQLYHCENSKKEILDFTVVNWTTNKASLEIDKVFLTYKILAQENNKIYFSYAKSLYYTTDSFITKSYITTLPFLPAKGSQMVITKYGYFLGGERKIYYSEDLKIWEISKKTNSNGIKDSFATFYNENEDVCYVLFGEYSCDNNKKHKLYKGKIDKNKNIIWKTVLDFYSINSGRESIANYLHTARHFHIVKFDPYTGFLWVGVGDTNEHSKILISKDFGDTFHLFGTGSQEWRTLSIWFTENNVYWNMDSDKPQKIFRCNRSEVYKNMGKKSLISNISDYNDALNISDNNVELRETVIDLSNGALFSSIEYKDFDHNGWIIMAGSPEGKIKDMRGRVFAIKEKKDSVDVMELISVQPKNIKAAYDMNMFTLLIPEITDNKGNIFFSARNLKINGLYKTHINWNKTNY